MQQQVAAEKEYGSGRCTHYDTAHGDPFAAYAARAKAGESEQHEAEELGVERGVKEPRSTLEPGQYPVDDAGCSAELFQSAVAEPVNVYDE